MNDGTAVDFTKYVKPLYQTIADNSEAHGAGTEHGVIQAPPSRNCSCPKPAMMISQIPIPVVQYAQVHNPRKCGASDGCSPLAQCSNAVTQGNFFF